MPSLPGLAADPPKSFDLGDPLPRREPSDARDRDDRVLQRGRAPGERGKAQQREPCGGGSDRPEQTASGSGDRRRRRRRRARDGKWAERAGRPGAWYRRRTFDPEPTGRAHSGGRRAPAARVRISKMRVVIAEDAAVMREGLARLLEDRGHEIVAAVADGDDLLEAATRHHPV